MKYDNRTALPEGYNLIITNANTINSYSVVIEREIGRGGSCIVYSGKQKDSIGSNLIERSVIVKEFFPKVFDTQIIRTEGLDLMIPNDLKHRFDNHKEAFTDGQTNHIIFANNNSGKALPPVAFSGEANNTFYVVANRGQGVTLSSIKQKEITLLRALNISASVSDAIGAVHNMSKLKLYLDCKPDNIYIFEDRAYLFDFDTVQPYGKYTMCSYSEGWSAPEQVFKDNSGYAVPKKIGFHTDIFSIGAVLFSMLIGHKPSEEDIENIQKGFDWKNNIHVSESEDGLNDITFIQELDRVMKQVLHPDADVRKELFGKRDAAVLLKHEFEHLAELVKNAPYRKGFKDTAKNISQAKIEIEQTIKKHSFKNFLFGSKSRIITTISAFIAVAIFLGIFATLGSRVFNSVVPGNVFAVEENMEEHILLKLSNANHQYEVGLENWRRLDYNRAERDIVVALESISEKKGQNETEVAKINNSLGCLYLDMGRYNDSYDYLNNAYITFKNSHGENSSETLSVLFSIAQYDYYSGDVETALKSLQQIIDRVDINKNKIIAVATYNFKGLIYDSLGDYDNAITSYESALELYEEILGDDGLINELANYVNDPELTQNEKDNYTSSVYRIITTYNNLGETYLHSGKYDEAAKVLDKALDMSLNNIYIGTRSLITSKLYMNQAKLYKQKGDIKKGIDNIDLAMRIQRNLFDFEGVYPGLVEVYDIYGELLLQKGNNQDAEKYFADALKLAQSSFGENHPSTAQAYNCIGEYHIFIEQYDSAEDEFETAIEVRRNILGYNNVNTVRYIYNLAVVKNQIALKSDALELLVEAKELCNSLGVTGEVIDLVNQLYAELEG